MRTVPSLETPNNLNTVPDSTKSNIKTPSVGGDKKNTNRAGVSSSNNNKQQEKSNFQHHNGNIPPNKPSYIKRQTIVNRTNQSIITEKDHKKLNETKEEHKSNIPPLGQNNAAARRTIKYNNKEMNTLNLNKLKEQTSQNNSHLNSERDS